MDRACGCWFPWPKFKTGPAYLGIPSSCLAVCFVHGSGVTACLPGLLLGGEEEEELHKGKLEGEPRFLWWLTASQAGPGPACAPRSPGKHLAVSSASSPKRKCQVPAIGVLVASGYFLFHLLCLVTRPVRKVPSNNNQRFSFLSHTAPSCLPLSLHVGR